jgi:hypothetical protein
VKTVEIGVRWWCQYWPSFISLHGMKAFGIEPDQTTSRHIFLLCSGSAPTEDRKMLWRQWISLLWFLPKVTILIIKTFFFHFIGSERRAIFSNQTIRSKKKFFLMSWRASISTRHVMK